MRRLTQALLLLGLISACAKFSAQTGKRPFDWRAVTLETISAGASLAEMEAALGKPVLEPSALPAWRLVRWSRKDGIARLWGHHLEHHGHLIARAPFVDFRSFAQPPGPEGWQNSREELFWMMGPSRLQTRPPDPRPVYRCTWQAASGQRLHCVTEENYLNRVCEFGLEWPSPGPDQQCTFCSPYKPSGLRVARR